MKVINRSSLSPPLKRALQREVDILRDFNHPNILRLIETYSTDQKYYLVTEILEGGELFDRIVEKSSYSESDARDLSKMLIQALEYCHLRRVAHRDLKVSNNKNVHLFIFPILYSNLIFFSLYNSLRIYS